MRRPLVLLAAMCTFFVSPGLRVQAQDGVDAKEKLIASIRMQGRAVGPTLEEIARSANIKLVMDQSVGKRKVTIDLSKVTAREALEAIRAKANLKFDFVSDDLVIVTAAEENTLENAAAMDSAAASHSAAAATSGTEVKNTGTRLLLGGIEHSDKLRPLEPGLRAGAQFDLVRLKSLTPNNNWYKIPTWNAGNWHTETNTSFHTRKYQVDSWENYLTSIGIRQSSSNKDLWEQATFTARSNERVGFQRDRSGQIWEFAYQNYVNEVEGDECIFVHFVREHTPIEITNDKVVIRYVGTECAVSKSSHRIGVARQKESINTYTSAGGNLLRCNYSVKTFDQDGKPERLADGIAMEIRTKLFEPRNLYEGQDMVKLFSEYLQSHGMEDLVTLPGTPVKRK